MKIKLEGMEELQKKLKDNVTLEDVKRVVKHNSAELQTRAQENAPVDSGTLKRSIELEIKDGGFTGEVESTAEYGAYVEFGTRFMDAQPHMGPAYRDQAQKFRQDMEKLVK